MTLNPYFRRRAAPSIGDAGRKAEKRIIQNSGGRARPASGAIKGFKGDIDLGAVLMEVKTTIHNSLSLKFDWLIKIKREARSEDKVPAIHIAFTDEKGVPLRDGEWVAIPLSEWRKIAHE